MKLNTEFVVIAYFVSLFVDWVFQVDWQAQNKSKWAKNDDKANSLLALWTHSWIYSLCTSLIVSILISKTYSNFFLMYGVLFITHLIIDTRILIKWIMKYIKGMTDEQINDYQNYGFLHIGIDHRLHEAVILILGFII